jgi:type I restriction enzyme S subunit
MKEGYKESALGLIPKSWAVTNIGDVATKVQDGNYGASYPKSNEFLAEGVPFLTSSTISSNIVNFDKLKYISEIKHIELKKAHIKENDVILTNRGANVGKCAITTPSLEDANIGPQVTLIRCKKDYDYNLLHQVIMSSIIQKQIANINSGSAMNFLSLKVTNALQIPFPPLPEQQRIAEILSTVDAKIEIIDQQISETQELKKGLMQQLLTKGIGHTEFKDSVLGKIPKSWEVLKVGDTCSLKGGFAFKSSDSCEHGIRWVKIANVGVNKIKWNDESFLPHGFEIQHRDFVLNEGDIILAMTRPILNGKLKIARISKFDSGSLLNQRVGRILENNNLNKDFAYQVFNSFLFISAMEKELVGTDPPNISSSMFEELNIALPPLKEQVEIAEILTSYDQKLEVLSEKKTTYQELKQGLMQQLLTGKMRV